MEVVRRPEGSIFVYCDDGQDSESRRQRARLPVHPGRRVAVTNFYRRDFDNRWCEWLTGPAAKSSAVTLFGDRVPDAESVRADIASRPADDPRADVRGRLRLPCRKCRRTLEVREPSLFAVLDVLAAHGVSEISLSQLDARLRRISTES